MDPHRSYSAARIAEHDFHTLRGLRYHVSRWPGDGTARPPLVLLHGWMDVGASFQFFVDALAAEEGFPRLVLAPDWRGFGRTETPHADSYWFPDYLADLDALLDRVAPTGAIDLVGHSMGGNVAMVYAGLRPERIRRLVNLEGFGMPETKPEMAPKRLLQWLGELKTPATLKPYDSVAAVAERLMQNNPLLPPDKAAWLAPHWSEQRDDGQWHLLADPAHKHVNPMLYQAPEVLETWKRITAPLLWVDGDRTDLAKWWGSRYTREQFEARLAVVPNVQHQRLSPAGHMLHHDQPEALARAVAAFLA